MSSGPACTPSTWSRSGPSGPAGAPDKALARPVTKVGIVGAGLMAAQMAPAVRPPARGAGGADRPGPGSGRRRASAYVHGEIDKLLAKQPGLPGPGQPAEGTGHRVADQGRLRRRGLRDRGGVRGAVGQAEGVRRGRSRRPAGLRAGHQHLLAVGDRRWPPSWSTPSGWSGSTSSTRSRCCRWSRSSAARPPTTPRWPPRSRSASSSRSPACWSRTPRRSWSTGC